MKDSSFESVGEALEGYIRFLKKFVESTDTTTKREIDSEERLQDCEEGCEVIESERHDKIRIGNV